MKTGSDRIWYEFRDVALCELNSLQMELSVGGPVLSYLYVTELFLCHMLLPHYCYM